jgi:hypothetical protein
LDKTNYCNPTGRPSCSVLGMEEETREEGKREEGKNGRWAKGKGTKKS